VLASLLKSHREWEIAHKITTVGTDGARNIIAGARILKYEHMACVAHIAQRVITVALCDSGFVDALAKCRKSVRHFKHGPANTAELNVQQASHGQEERSLVQDVPTSWNSTLEMMKLTMLTSAEYDRLPKMEALLGPCR